MSTCCRVGTNSHDLLGSLLFISKGLIKIRAESDWQPRHLSSTFWCVSRPCDLGPPSLSPSLSISMSNTMAHKPAVSSCPPHTKVLPTRVSTPTYLCHQPSCTRESHLDLTLWETGTATRRLLRDPCLSALRLSQPSPLTTPPAMKPQPSTCASPSFWKLRLIREESGCLYFPTPQAVR